MTEPFASTGRATQRSHPAPHRDRVGLLALFFGIVAAPTAWNLQILLGSALSAHACFPRDRELAAPLWSNLWMVMLIIALAAIAVSIASGLVAFHSWRLTQAEAGGSGDHLVSTGRGRTRFLAMFGILTSGLFLVATLFALAVLFVVPVCV